MICPIVSELKRARVQGIALLLLLKCHSCSDVKDGKGISCHAISGIMSWFLAHQLNADWTSGWIVREVWKMLWYKWTVRSRNRRILTLVADGCWRRGGLRFAKVMILDHITIATLGLICSYDIGVILVFLCVSLKQCQMEAAFVGSTAFEVTWERMRWVPLTAIRNSLARMTMLTYREGSSLMNSSLHHAVIKLWELNFQNQEAWSFWLIMMVPFLLLIAPVETVMVVIAEVGLMEAPKILSS